MDYRVLYRLSTETDKKNMAEQGPLRVAILMSEFPSLNETFILDHITGLIDRGHAVHIYATGPENVPKVHEDVLSYKLLDRTIYRDSPKFAIPRNKVRRSLKATVLLVQGLLKNPRATLTSLNIVRFGKGAASLMTLYRGAPFFNSYKYDIVHCHFPENGQLAVFLRDIGAINGKIVTSFHGYKRPYIESKSQNHVFDDLFTKGDLFLSCSDHMKQWFDRAGWGGGKIIVHRYGVHVNRFFPSKSPSHNHGQVRLLSVGRLVEKKGFEYAIKGVAKILHVFPTIQYDIAGDGPERTKLEKLITKLGVGRNIRLHGWQERAEVLQLFGQANLFLAPSVTSHDGDQEGIPLVLHEAMALGLPVISTCHTGIPELVQDGESGFLVAERDVDGIADRLTHLMKHPETWPEMGQKGRKHIEEFNNLDRQNDRLIDIYQLLMDPHARSRDGLDLLLGGKLRVR
jgi:colanic acid/amylovoran biosynthesis glycosyltransferase